MSVDSSLPITPSDDWQEIINAIGLISTGKKWAEGRLQNNANGYVTVTDLDFTPTIIIAQASVWLGSFGNYYMPNAFYAKFIGDNYSFYGNRYQDAGKELSMNWRALPFSTTSKLSSGYSFQNEFKIDLKHSGNHTLRWIAFE